MIAETLRALVVEDNRAWQQILRELLADVGLTVDVVDNVEDAVAALRAVSHQVAVVDLALGDGDYDNEDGLRVLEAVRQQDPGCVAVMLTGFATVELAVSVLNEYGAFSCLRKEAFDRGEFRGLIEQVLARPPASAVESEVEGEGVALALLPTLEAATAPVAALVVEDDAGWRSILTELLSDVGYRVVACRSFGEALGRLRRETFAVAVIDLALAETDTAPANPPPAALPGYRLLARTQADGIPTIVVSGFAAPEGIARVYEEHGVFAYLEKQAFDRRTFLSTVAEARADHDDIAALDSLTEREREVLALLVEGLTNKEIAKALVITINTVKRHVKAIFRKLDVHTRSAAAAMAAGAGLAVDVYS